MKDGTNWNGMAGMLINFGDLAIMGTAFLTQLLAFLGIATGINGMVWWYGVGMALPALHFIASFFYFFAKESAWAEKDTKDATVATHAKSTAGQADLLWIQDLMTLTGIGVMMMHNYEGWMANQWIGMAPEDQDAAIEELEEAVAEIAKEQMAKWEGAAEKKEGKKEEAEDDGEDEEEGEEGAEGEDGEGNEGD
jgi:hypothetical protein